MEAELFPSHNIEELHSNAQVYQVHIGRLKQKLTVFKVYDKSDPKDFILDLEAGDEVLVATHYDGSRYVQFMSLTPRTFRYQAAVDLDQVELMKEVQ